jgi:hypothetical protein
VTPAFAGVGPKYCTFSSLKDVGLPLPNYGEEIVRLDLTPTMSLAEYSAQSAGCHVPWRARGLSPARFWPGALHRAP